MANKRKRSMGTEVNMMGNRLMRRKVRGVAAVVNKVSCLFCGRGFRSNYFLEEHMNLHTRECHFQCSECDAGFLTSQLMNSHRRKCHPDRKPVFRKKKTVKKCLFCGRGFKTFWHLQMHMNGHTRERTFQCGQCEEGFISLATLHNHRDRVHVGLSFDCKLCARKFTQMPQLKAHHRQIHENVTGLRRRAIKGFGELKKLVTVGVVEKRKEMVGENRKKKEEGKKEEDKKVEVRKNIKNKKYDLRRVRRKTWKVIEAETNTRKTRVTSSKSSEVGGTRRTNLKQIPENKAKRNIQSTKLALRVASKKRSKIRVGRRKRVKPEKVPGENENVITEVQISPSKQTPLSPTPSVNLEEGLKRVTTLSSKSEEESREKEDILEATSSSPPKKEVLKGTPEKEVDLDETPENEYVLEETLQPDAVLDETLEKEEVLEETPEKKNVSEETPENEEVLEETLENEEFLEETLEKENVLEEEIFQENEDVLKSAPQGEYILGMTPGESGVLGETFNNTSKEVIPEKETILDEGFTTPAQSTKVESEVFLNTKEHSILTQSLHTNSSQVENSTVEKTNREEHSSESHFAMKEDIPEVTVEGDTGTSEDVTCVTTPSDSDYTQGTVETTSTKSSEKPHPVEIPTSSQQSPSDNSEYPSLVLMDPITNVVTPFPSPNVLDQSVVTLGLDQSQPANLYFSVNGQVTMPVFSIEFLNYLARRSRKARSPSPYYNSSREDEEEEAESEAEPCIPETRLQPPIRKKLKKSSIYRKSTLVKGGDPSKPHKCPLCGSSFYAACHLATHLKYHKKNKPESGSILCKFCASSFQSQMAVIMHISVQHNHSDNSAKPFGCPFCLKSGKKLAFKEKPRFIRHLQSHWIKSMPDKVKDHKKSKSMPPTASKVIGKSKREKPPKRKLVPTKKKVPVKWVKKGGKYWCHLCTSSFRWPGNLRRHLKIHAGLYWPCTICGKRNSRLYALARHYAGIHSSSNGDQVGFPCPLCSTKKAMKLFENKTNLISHILKDHRSNLQEVSENRADENAKKTPSSSSVLPTSSSEQASKPSIKRTKPKRFKCQHCGKFFTDRSNLIVHTRIHTGEKPFPCPFCNYRFNQRCHLARHLSRAHSSQHNNPPGITNLVCPFCRSQKKVWDDKLAVYKHILSTHGDSLREEVTSKKNGNI